MNSGLVILKSLEEEIVNYENRTLRNLRIYSHVPRQESLFKQNQGKRKRKRKSNVIRKEVKNILKEESQRPAESRDTNESRDDLTLISSEEVKSTCEEKEKESFIAEVGESVEKKPLKSELQTIEQITDEKPCGYLTEEKAEDSERVNENEASGLKIYDGASSDERSPARIKEVEDNSSDLEIISDSFLIRDDIECSRMSAMSNMETSEERKLSDTIPELNSFRSLTPNLSRSSSCHQFVPSQHSSSDFSWNEDSNSLLQDYSDADETATQQPSLTGTSLKIYPQLFLSSKIYATAFDSPSRERVISTLNLYDIPSKDNGKPFWSDANDVALTSKTKDIRHQSALIGTNLISHLPNFGNSSLQVMCKV